MAGKLGGAIPLSMGAGAVDDLGEMFDGLGELEIIPEFLKMTDHLAIELEVIPIDAPALHFKVRKRHFLSHLYIKGIILPRQARDKHRKNSKKVPFSRRMLRRLNSRQSRR